MVEIKEIEYVDHLRMLWQENENNDATYITDSNNDFEWLKKYSTSGSADDHIKEENNSAQTQTEAPMKLVRGLAAKHDISVGDVVISIPLYSLLSVPTTIDHDPVLSRILGPKARQQYGWTDTLDYEVPLLVITDFEWLKKYSTSGSADDHIKEENNSAQTQTEAPMKLVRGLAAKHDISVGDVVISIPLYSLLSVPTTIDHDPVLSRILGPKARQQYGWTDTLDYEVPLLVITVLYHRSLGMESPLSHYIDVLLGSPADFPFLWSNQELRDNTDKIGAEVKKLANGIQRDLHEMYDRIMGKLVTEHPDLFAPPPSNEESVEEWMYSYKNFQWAFALVISRHHYLPIQDLDSRTAQSELASESSKVVHRTTQHNFETIPSDSSVSEVVPPANQPTDSWVDLAIHEEKVVDNVVVEDDQDKVIPAYDDDIIAPSGFLKHSFLAPLADMINFGPPCLTGSYNPDEHVFELIATCPFKAGQEVTFYYSSECADVIIANYAFLHPLVPPCASLDEVKEKSEEWKNQAMVAEEKLWKAHRQVDVLKGEILALESQLQSCESGEDKVYEKELYSMPTSSENSKTAGDEMPSDSETTPSHQKLRKEGQPSSSRNHEVGVRGRIHEPSHQEFDEQIMEELG